MFVTENAFHFHKLQKVVWQSNWLRLKKKKNFHSFRYPMNTEHDKLLTRATYELEGRICTSSHVRFLVSSSWKNEILLKYTSNKPLTTT
jgi:hypothetical protein